MRIDDLDAPSGEFVARAPLHVVLRGPNWVFPVNAASDSLAASVFAVSVAPLPTFADGTDLGYTPFSPSFRSHYMTTMHRTLVR